MIDEEWLRSLKFTTAQGVAVNGAGRRIDGLAEGVAGCGCS